MKTIKLLAAPLAAIAAAMGAAIPANAQSIYRLDATTTTGLDLTSMSGYYADRMEGPLSADVTFSGPLTVDPAVSAANPFQLIGNGMTIRVNAAGSGFHSLPLKLYNATGKTGQSRLMFKSGDTYSGGSIDVGQYNVLYFDFDKCFVNSGTASFHNGGKIYGRGVTIGQNLQSSVSITDGANVECDYFLRFGQQTAATESPVKAFMGITNATVKVGTGLAVNLNTGNGGIALMNDVSAASDTENCRVVLGPGGILKSRFVSHHGGGRSTIAFDGGKYTDQGATTAPLFHVYGHNYAGGWPSPWMFVEGINGNPIDITISTDRNLAGGEVNGTRKICITGNGGFTKRGAGTLYFNRHNGANSYCDYTGPTAILGGGIVVTNSVFKPGRGALTVAEGAFLDLNTFDAEFSDATGAGIVSNRAATVSTLSLGYGNADGAFSIALGERVNVAKTGTGTLTVSGAALANTCDLTVSAGTVVFSGDSTSYGTVTVESGATLDASAVEFACARLVKQPGATVLTKPKATTILMR